MNPPEAATAAAGAGLLRLAQGLDRALGSVATKCTYLSAALSLVMAGIILLDLTLRNFWGVVIDAIIELETFLLIIITFFSIAQTQREGRHISVDIFTTRMKEGTRRFLNVVFSLCGLYLFLILCWQLYSRASQEYFDGKLTLISEMHFWPFTGLAALGCLLMVLVLLQQFIKSLGELLTTRRRPLPAAALALAIAVAVALAPWLYESLALDFGKTGLAVLIIGLALGFMFLGFPVAFAMGLFGMLGTWCLAGPEIALGSVRLQAYDAVSEYYLCVIPFFIVMGLFCLNAGISKALFSTAHKWLARIPGGLAIATIMGCGGFAAICGDSMANAATMSSVALPEMKKYGYNDSLATGSVAAGGTLGILIPPSIGFIAYGIITEQSVGKLFMAGIIPGLIMIGLFSAMIMLMCKMNPGLGPTSQGFSWKQKMLSLRGPWKVVVLFVLVMGGIYSGIVTPTEAGGVGLLGALVLAAMSAEFNWAQLRGALTLGIEMSAMIITLLIGVAILGNFITLTELPISLSSWLESLNLSRYVFFACILVLYLFLGMVMNIIPMIMVTLPIIFPSIIALGFDPIWFGVVMVIMMEMGQISPPVGINVFVIHSSVEGIPMGTIFRGVVPFIAVQVITIAILTLFPLVVTFLPEMMDVLPSISN
ncbi:MAG: TRAP transporter large permease subunit [Deltaproteobacteria bacterium]|nr:TRAP transporter large permease subunit [Deltaproteobacteria bacterium]